MPDNNPPGYDVPSADSQSIPSSVDPDANPLGECEACGGRSRRAYSEARCPECAESPITPASGDPREYEIYLLPVDVVWRRQPRSALAEEFKDAYVIQYRPLKKVNESEWLISVGGRVYVAPEEMLERGLEEVG